MAKTPGSAREIVLERHPQAQAQHHDTVYQYGQASPAQEASWAVYVAPGLGQRQLGTGPTELAAWTNASTEVLKDLRQPTGLEIGRDTLNDAGAVGGGPTVAEELEDAAEASLDVTIREHDGSRTPVERKDG